jgi:hypothetical protein
VVDLDIEDIQDVEKALQGLYSASLELSVSSLSGVIELWSVSGDLLGYIDLSGNTITFKQEQ